MKIQIFCKIMALILILAVISPLSFMLEDGRRSSIGEESLHHLCKCYVSIMLQKVPEEQKKKNEK
jgi:hypothetical protein